MLPNTFNILVKTYINDENGASAIIYALALPLIIGMFAFGVELGHFQQKNARFQNSADMAAIAAALEFNATLDNDKAKNAARGTAWENGFVFQDGSIEVEFPIVTGDYAGVEGAIVRIRQDQDRYFSHIFPTKQKVEHVLEATALVTHQPICTLALDPTASGALTVTGSADIEMDKCAMHSNSTSSTSFDISGSGNLTADCVSASGGISSGGTLTLTECPAKQPYKRQVDDPYRFVDVPLNVSTMPCKYPIATGNLTVDMFPGRYCPQNLNTNAKITLREKGVYIFDGMDFLMKAKASLIGPVEGATIILMNGAEIENTNGGMIELYAQSTGTYAGIAIYSDRDTSDPNALVRLNGNQNARIEGALYYPVQKIDFRGGADVISDCTQIVAREIEFSGNSALRNRDCKKVGAKPIQGGGIGAKLVN